MKDFIAYIFVIICLIAPTTLSLIGRSVSERVDKWHWKALVDFMFDLPMFLSSVLGTVVILYIVFKNF
ncbi:MAG: hypothetical protein SPE06_03490 [[Actinobacillus] rossii]|nr:hypothetical protein [[Actinobacillus] rossii]MDY4505465.1 hypothetical protein [[Actinobacillus] rossii]